MRTPTLIIITLLAIIAALIWFWPSPTDESAAIYRDSLKVLKAEKAVISSRINSNLEASRTRAKSDSIKLAASLKEIARLKVKASKAAEAIPVRVLQENPEIMIAIVAKDSVITKQGQAIDSLQASLAFQIKVKEDLMTDHYNADKINAQLQEMAQVRIVKLEKENRKLRRRAKVARVLLPVVAGLSLLIGQAF